MSAILVFLLRILLAASLYAFLGWALYTIWSELRLNSQLISRRQIPVLSITTLNLDENISKDYNTPEVILGRDPECGLPIADDTVSARHARLSYHHNQWWAEDLQSTNGTFLNDERILTPTVIISGDEIRCGKAVLMLTYESK
jgi:hypothetical protein